MQYYCQLQLLTIIYNNIHRKILATQLILGGIWCFSVSAFVLISKASSIRFSAVLIFSNLMVLGIADILVCFHFAAMFNKMSILTLARFRSSLVLVNELYKRKLVRKYLRSMSPLKIKFLHCNYFDRLTPLVFFRFSIRLAIHLTLINQ